MSSHFEFQTTQSHRLSDDGTSDYSNVEHPNSDHITHTPGLEDLYWLGSQVLSYKLARAIISRPPNQATTHDLDLELLRRKSAIPYSARLALIGGASTHTEEFPANTTRSSDSYAYCVALGRLTASGGEHNERELDLLITGETVSNGPSPANENRPGHLGGATPFDNANVATETQMAHYSMALKEYGDMVGREASYSIVPSPTYPASFLAYVTMNGSRYEGSARTKKQAKHFASRAACRAIGIRV